MSFFERNFIRCRSFGTLGGLLLAPRKGEETREKLITNTRELVVLTDELNDNLADFRESVTNLKETFDTFSSRLQIWRGKGYRGISLPSGAAHSTDPRTN